MSRWEMLIETLLGTSLALGATFLFGNTAGRALGVAFSAYCLPMVFILAAYVAARANRLEGWAALKGPNTPVQSTLYWMAGALALALGLQVGLPLVYGLVLHLLKPEAVREAARTTQVALFRWPGMSPMLFRSLVGSPISEELLVRGCLLSFFQKREVAPFRIGRVVLDGPNLLSSLAFALFHLMNKGETALQLAAVWVISMFLGKARRKTGGLAAPMFCHSVFNFVGHTVFQFVKA